MFDSNKVAFAIKYNGNVAGTDAVGITNEDARFSPNVSSGSFKCMNGKMGNKTIWKNMDDVTIEGVTIESFLLGNDSTGNALDTLPDWSDMYQVCGLTQTVDTATVGEETVTYTPSQTQIPDSEAALWRDGRKRVATGVMGSLKISAKIGEPIKQTSDLVGFTTITSTAEANPSASCADEELLLVMKSTDTLTLTGTSYAGTSFDFDQKNDLGKILGIGKKFYNKKDFDSTISITYYKENEDIYTDFENGTSHAIVFKAGSTSGMQCTIKADNAVVESLSEGTNEGKETVTVQFSLQGDVTGENQFSIQFGYSA